MPRQTAFPGIWVESIEVETPPFDEPGTIQEFVGQGMLSDLEPIQRAADFSEETVGDVIESAEEMIGPLRDTYRIKYNLLVRASPPAAESIAPDAVVKFGRWIRGRSVRTRARAFARAKNPFEPEVLEVKNPSKNSRMSGETTGDIYDVKVRVTK